MEKFVALEKKKKKKMLLNSNYVLGTITLIKNSMLYSTYLVHYNSDYREIKIGITKNIRNCN